MAERESRGIRAKTAGRFPDSTWRAGTPSLYHEKCAPQTERVKSAPPKTYAQREYAKCDIVRNDEIWKNRCRNEGKMARKWEENWGFLKDYDPKGRFKPPKELPDKVSVFSDKVPNTTSQQFGHRVKSAPARTMQKFERLTNYRVKTNKELLCYD
ncbi:unnamed protein product [Porites lobata]|uniref:Uncharacterized protein n=1 Tax=Porites lobata TaxID=104759 RepID=A0ABN8Q2B0_9CNID|nr:unnamed protein product [Porites lobata]